MLLGDQAEVSGLRVRWNRLDGIFVNFGSNVSSNTAYANGQHGITALSGSAVQRNTVVFNGGYGLGLQITAASDAAYRENVITSNTMGTVLGGVNAGDNVCNASLTCP